MEFQELIASDPVVRLYMTEMIEQVPKSKPYRKRHLTSVDQMLRLINEVLTMAHRRHVPQDSGRLVRS